MKSILLLIICSHFIHNVHGQQSEVSMGGVNTTSNELALNLLLKYLPDMGEKASFAAGKNKSFSGNPEINIQTGGKDAFNGLVVKYNALFIKFKKIKVEGIETMDLSKSFHIFPIALGFEGNRNFTTSNGISEAGWVPWYQNNKNVNKHLRKTKFGIFLQAGYKFKEDSMQNAGGATDESSEKEDNAIGRIKSSFIFFPEKKFSENFSIGFIGEATGWADALNQKIYYHLEAILRFKIAAQYSLDFKYEKGSGAPNFNQGDQFGGGLSITY